MQSGQAHTIWFSELKIILKDRWAADLTIAEQFKLVTDLNCRLNQIRIDNNIQPPMMWCPKCKKRERSRFTKISITGMYYALKRFEICTDKKFKELQKKWKKYSIERDIDIYGNLKNINQIENERHN